jgi:hypothetical protein
MISRQFKLGFVLTVSIFVLSLNASTSLAQQIPIAGTTAPQTGAFTPSGTNDLTQAEFPGQADDESGPGPYPGSNC